MRVWHLVFLLAAACQNAADPAWARADDQSPGETTIAGAPRVVSRAGQPPLLDGKLDDRAWQTAAVLSPLVQPDEGGAAASDDPVAGVARLTERRFGI